VAAFLLLNGELEMVSSGIDVKIAASYFFGGMSIRKQTIVLYGLRSG